MTHLVANKGASLDHMLLCHNHSARQGAPSKYRQQARQHAAATAVSRVVHEETCSATAIAPVKLDPEVKAKHKRPAGWTAPGPQPYGKPTGEPDLVPKADETLSYLTGDWRIFQLRNGHRWSMDDMMTAYVALQEAAAIQQQQQVAAAAQNGCAADNVNALGGPILKD